MFRKRPVACRRLLLCVDLLVGARPARSSPKSRPVVAALMWTPCCRTCLQMECVVPMPLLMTTLLSAIS
eukprot:8874607-Pyramimonas_sp.AAC.1